MGTCQKDHNSLTDTNKKIFPALTGYRAIAAWIIFVYHFMPFNNPKYPASIKQFVWGFHIGVDMFFVLSGFLITYRYFNDRPIDFKKYILNRFARIYTMYILITLLVFMVYYLQYQNWNIQKNNRVYPKCYHDESSFCRFFMGRYLSRLDTYSGRNVLFHSTHLFHFD